MKAHGFAALMLILLTSCASPVLQLKTGGPTALSLGAQDAVLMFHLGSRAHAAYGVADVGLLTLQLRSSGQSSRYARTNVDASGNATLTLPGIQAGSWLISVLLYDWDGVTPGGLYWSGNTTGAPELLFVGDDQVQIRPGQTTDLSLLVYRPGDLTPGSLLSSQPAASVVVSDGAGTSSQRPVGDATLSLGATVLDTASALTVDQRVAWSSSNPAVATVDATGHVTLRQPGLAAMTATSVAGGVVSPPYQLTVLSPLVGVWRYDPANATGSVLLDVTQLPDSSLQARWITGYEGLGSVSVNRLSLVATATGWALSTAKVPVLYDFASQSWYQSEVPLSSLTVIPNGTSTVQIGWGNSASASFQKVTPYQPPVAGWTMAGVPTQVAVGQAGPVPLPMDFAGTGSLPGVVWVSSNYGVASPTRGGFSTGSVGQASLTAFSIADPSQSLVFPISVINPLTEGVGRYTYVAANQSGDGSWLVSGSSGGIAENTTKLLARYRPDGTQDLTFGGYRADVVWPPVPGALHDAISAEAQGFIQDPTSHEITLQGYYQNGWGNNHVERFDAQGVAVSAFQPGDEQQFVPVGPPALDAAGNLYSLGVRTGPNVGTDTFVLQKMAANGALDSSYALSAGGSFWTSDRNAAAFGAARLTVDNTVPATPRFLVVGTGGQVARVTNTGGLDTSFGTNLPTDGWADLSSVWGANATIRSARLDAAGNILIVGDNGATGFVARLTSSGVLDTTFNSAGATPGWFALSYLPLDLAVQPADGKVVVVGDTDLTGQEVQGDQAFAFRFDPTQTTISGDTSFGTLGTGYDLPAGNTPWGSGARSVAVDATGRIAVAGFTKNDGGAGSRNTVPALWLY